MRLSDAVQQAESWFQVHREVGYPEPFYLGDNPQQAETRDMSRAPCGQPYVTVTSGGVKEEGDPIPVWFAHEDAAASHWLFSIEDYAKELRPVDDWGKLHLYWRDEPRWQSVEMIALDQAALLGQSHPLAAELMHATLGVVWSRLLISKLRPDGTEEE